MITTTAPSPAESTSPRLRRVALASLAGTTIEFYDFFIYGTAAALVFGSVFFPALGSAAATAASFATLAVAFFFRPLGSLLFGHFGDRLGRKRTLIATLLLMGGSTVAIGLLPDAATIGAAAPVLLVVLRACQGLAVGGEWAGAVLLTAENAPTRLRGRYSMFPQLGPALAFGLSSLTFLLVHLAAGETDGAFLGWAWRVPFLLSAVLIGIGLYVRLRVTETPVFAAATERRPVPARTPLREVLHRQPRAVLLVAGALTTQFAFFYIATTYLTGYATARTGLGMDRASVLIIGIIAAAALAAGTIASARWSDRFGRRPVIAAASAALCLWAPALFPIVETRSPVLVALALTITLGLLGLSYGPAGAYLPEIFPTSYRYTGAGVGYNLAGILGGALPLVVAAPLAASPLGSLAIGLFLTATAVVSLACVLALPETRHVGLAEPAAQPA